VLPVAWVKVSRSYTLQPVQLEDDVFWYADIEGHLTNAVEVPYLVMEPKYDLCIIELKC